MLNNNYLKENTNIQQNDDEYNLRIFNFSTEKKKGDKTPGYYPKKMKRQNSNNNNNNNNSGSARKKKKPSRPGLLPIPAIKRNATDLEVLESVLILDEDQTMFFNRAIEENFSETMTSQPDSNSVQVDFGKLLESPKIPGDILSKDANGLTNYFVDQGRKAAKQSEKLAAKAKPKINRAALNSLSGGGIDLNSSNLGPSSTPSNNNNNFSSSTGPDILRIFSEQERNKTCEMIDDESGGFSSTMTESDRRQLSGGGDLSSYDEKRITVYWYCGNCSKNQIKTQIDIDDENVTKCPKCHHLKAIKQVFDVTQEETEAAALVIENIINTLNPTPTSRIPSLQRIPSLSRGPSLSRTNSLSTPIMPALSRNISGASALFDMDLFRQDSQRQGSWSSLDLDLDNNNDNNNFGSIRPTALAPQLSIGFGANITAPSLAPQRSMGFGANITAPTGVARQHSLALIGDNVLSNYVGENFDDKNKSKVKLCWICPNVTCKEEIDLWDKNPGCLGCGYLKPTKTPILTLNKTFRCSICSKMFSRKHTLREHMNIHTNKRPYGCKWPGCKQRFNDPSNKRAHEKMSCKFMEGKPEKKFGCDLCPTRTEKDPVTGKMITIYTKLYARRIDLLDHKTSKHGGNPKPYACEVCGKRYANKANVSRHKKKAHNGGDVDSVKKKKKKGKTEKKNKSTENKNKK